MPCQRGAIRLSECDALRREYEKKLKKGGSSQVRDNPLHKGPFMLDSAKSLSWSLALANRMVALTTLSFCCQRDISLSAKLLSSYSTRSQLP